MKSDRICAACGTPFTPLIHIPHQRFCSAKACQRARRRAWQHERLRVDPDYREIRSGLRPTGEPDILTTGGTTARRTRPIAIAIARCSDDEMCGALLVLLQTWTCGRHVAHWHLDSTSCATRLRPVLQR